MDGKTFDPLYNDVSSKWNINILEPITYQFKKLQLNYKNKKNIKLFNNALDYKSGKVKMYTINPETLKNVSNNNKLLFANGISSFYKDRNSLGKEYWDGRGKVHEKIGLTFNSIKDSIIETYVDAINIDELNLEKIDILQSDTESFDYYILNIVLKKYRPYVILFEWNNLPNNELNEIKILLKDYKTIFYQQDALCILLP